MSGVTDPVVVVGGGISGAACAQALVEEGRHVVAFDRGRRLGGRMASRTLRDTGTAFDGRVVDIGASYFTVSDPHFERAIESLLAAEVVRAWTDSFHLAEPDGIGGVKAGPLRYSAPGGLRSVVEALWHRVEGVDLRFPHDVQRVQPLPDGRLLVDDRPASAVAVCVPEPQARRFLSDELVGALDDDGPVWEPVIVVTAVFGERHWPELDGVFVNDDPVITWIADDGRRRGDDAPVLVAHVHPVLAAHHLEQPRDVIPMVLASMQHVLGISALPDWVDAHRWTFAKPTAARPTTHWAHPTMALGLAGDAWCQTPRVEAAWCSGRALGQALARRLAE